MIANWKEVLMSTQQLDSERILLRRFNENDAQDIFEYGSDDETLKYIVWGGVKTLEEVHDSLKNYYLVEEGCFAIELKENHKCLGAIDLRMMPEHEKASFGYGLNRRYWNKGYMSEALSALLKFAFNTLELNRVESTHYVGNEGSGKVMQKCGMKQEGVFKREVKVKGIFHNVVHYGILRDEMAQNTVNTFQNLKIYNLGGEPPNGDNHADA